MQTWKTRARRTVLQHNHYLTVEYHTVELPDGRVIEDWPWIITPDYVNVLAETAQGEYLCFRQVKYGVEGTSLAPVGGYLEPGEAPLDGARRELLEEMGCEAPEWVDLGRYRTDANRGAGTGYLYLARGARQVAEPQADDLEEQQVLRLSRSELAHALAAGEFKVLAWAMTVALSLLRL
ncbi:MAG TPA: NUDIX hydrolase [Anaerolineae bacterium]|nr:NUDIX hydrolase [Anaerolineae bacterium]HOQ99353.1 NUDIX hydrolase [Anaerolineae bacterium]HPL26790.1 NUDIX hydrolase [Anaerolineae bacterium]